MILDKTVKMKWNNSIIKFYTNKGYVYTKSEDEFEVKIEDLSQCASVNVYVKCDVCGEKRYTSYLLYIMNIENSNFYSCCKKCSKEKTKQTCLKLYGKDHAVKNDNVKKKIKNTKKERYDDENYNNKEKAMETNMIVYNHKHAAQNDEVKKKIKNTKKERYGDENYSNIEQIKKTNLKRYGVEHSNNIEKMKQTNIEKFGVEYYTQTDDFKERYKQTCLKKYNVDNYTKTKEFKENLKKFMLLKFGVEYYTQTEEMKLKTKITCLKKYGVEFSTQSEEIKEKIRQSCIEKYGEIYINYIPKYNINSIIFLDMISERINLHIQHALNGGEKKFIRYWIDGYNSDFNICIEWNEKQHYTKKGKQKDIKKYQFLKEKFNCKIFEINEKEFLLDIENNIQKISKEILDYIDSLIIS
jgi:hypothetical protein